MVKADTPKYCLLVAYVCKLNASLTAAPESASETDDGEQDCRRMSNSALT